MTQPPSGDITSLLVSRSIDVLNHFNDSPDFSRDSIHHTLGISSTQASPGDHTHLGDSKSKGITQLTVGTSKVTWDGSTLTVPGSMFAGHNQLFGDALALSFTTGALFQASVDSIRPVVIRGHSLTQSGSLLELQRSDTAIHAFFDANGLFNQRGVAGAGVGTKFVNNANNADLHFANIGDGLEYIIIGIGGSIFRAAADNVTPLAVRAFSNTQSNKLQEWQLVSGVAVANVDGTGQPTFSGLWNNSNATITTTAPAAGGAGALPATPAGYWSFFINGSTRRLPFYV